MKLLTFSAAGRVSYGALAGDAIIDLGSRMPYPSLRAALAADALPELRAAARDCVPDWKLTDVALLTPLPDAEKIVCVGVNYKAHILEMGKPLPERPSVFLKLHSSLSPPDAPIVRPKASVQFDYEGELAVVIGTAGRHITREKALDHVAGYTCFNDGTLRDVQKTSLILGKNFGASSGMGPWMVTADEIPDPSRLTLETRVNGERRQHGTTDDLIFDIPAIIAFVSAVIPLAPGDIIATGTPAGVAAGRNPPLWLEPGDVVEVEISHIGVLRNSVVDED